MSVKFGNLPLKTLGTLLPELSLPRVYAVLFGVAAGTGADQAPGLAAAAASVPTSGGILVLPCGQISLSSITLAHQNLIVEGGGQNCTTISSLSQTGDVMIFTGSYSGVRDVGFRQAGAANGAGFITGGRTSGYTVNLSGAYQFAERVSFQHCYRCLRMGITAGYGRVSQVDMSYLTADATSLGGGGIFVDNPKYGPDNWIDHATIYGDSGGGPAKRIRVRSRVSASPVPGRPR